jgi:hypothetical protein
MPQPVKGDMRGLQLWVNLPASDKMMDPRYRDIQAESIPLVEKEGVKVKVIAGRYGDVSGPVSDLVQDPGYLDVSLSPGAVFGQEFEPGHTVFSYVLDGSGRFYPGVPDQVHEEYLVHYGPGDRVEIEAGGTGMRFLLISGQPIGEPVAWKGPIVMNTEEELYEAFREYRNGTFIKVGDEPSAP